MANLFRYLEGAILAILKNKPRENLLGRSKLFLSFFFSDSAGAESTIFYKIDAHMEMLA
jgi:hypothetical protein